MSRNVNNTEANFERTEDAMTFFKEVTGVLYYDACSIILKVVPGTWEPVLYSSHKAFNMLCMSQELCHYWRQGYFGLKPVKCEGSTDCGGDVELITVEFRWLTVGFAGSALDNQHTHPGQRGIRAPYKLVNLESENLSRFVLQGLEAQERENDHVPNIVSTKTGRRITSGMKFHFKVHRDDAEKTRCLLEFQWMTAQLAALCGATSMVSEIPAELLYHHHKLLSGLLSNAVDH